MNFYTALRLLNNGAKITRLEWGNPAIYGVLRDSKVMLHKTDLRFYDWIISDGDLQADDWIVSDYQAQELSYREN